MDDFMENCIKSIEEYRGKGYIIEGAYLFIISPECSYLTIRLNKQGRIRTISLKGKQIPAVEKYLHGIKVRITKTSFS
jgi:hypothetical protein